MCVYTYFNLTHTFINQLSYTIPGHGQRVASLELVVDEGVQPLLLQVGAGPLQQRGHQVRDGVPGCNTGGEGSGGVNRVVAVAVATRDCYRY